MCIDYAHPYQIECAEPGMAWTPRPPPFQGDAVAIQIAKQMQLRLPGKAWRVRNLNSDEVIWLKESS